MIETAIRFLQSLTPDQLAVTQLDLDSRERYAWHYFPEIGFRDVYGHDRPGVTFKDMSPQQRLLAYALLSASVSQAGFVKAMNVMSMEEVVRVMENDTTGMRDPEMFHISIFGTPAATGTWGWRVEGHHLSLNFLILDGRVIASSPTFLGANPHEVPAGPQKGMRALGREEDLAITLMDSLTPTQRERAVFLDIAPFDIVTMASVRAQLEGEPQGLPASNMNDHQLEVLMSLVEEYANNMPPEIASERMSAARDASPDGIFFGWAGSTERRLAESAGLAGSIVGNRAEAGNYYRIHSPTFLVEYDNTQNNSNHTHSVWRDFRGDFGLDVLAEHYRSETRP